MTAKASREKKLGNCLLREVWKRSHNVNIHNIMVLVDAGASLSVRDKDGMTPLMRAAERGYVNLALRLIEKGAPIDGADHNGMTPLMFAASRVGNVSIVSALIKKGANMDAQNRAGYTALMLAVIADDDTSAPLLAMKGANLDIRNCDGRAAEDYARDLKLGTEKPLAGYLRYLRMKSYDCVILNAAVATCKPLRPIRRR